MGLAICTGFEWTGSEPFTLNYPFGIRTVQLLKKVVTWTRAPNGNGRPDLDTTRPGRDWLYKAWFRAPPPLSSEGAACERHSAAWIRITNPLTEAPVRHHREAAPQEASPMPRRLRVAVIALCDLSKAALKLESSSPCAGDLRTEPLTSAIQHPDDWIGIPDPIIEATVPQYSTCGKQPQNRLLITHMQHAVVVPRGQPHDPHSAPRVSRLAPGAKMRLGLWSRSSAPRTYPVPGRAAIPGPAGSGIPSRA